jgi:HAE1 family hydrophobic/amphiphilic exporter-1
MLIGIVVNNAILIMDQAAHYSKQGMNAHEAMIHAATDEFRPIVMITLAAILGMLPMALGAGLGSEVRIGIGIASVGGIGISALLTLLVMPVIYDFFTRENGKKGSSTAH